LHNKTLNAQFDMTARLRVCDVMVWCNE